MFSNLLDEDTKKIINDTLFQIKCYLIIIVLLLIIIAYYIHENNLKI